MKINLARNIDYWLGIPICFFLSVLCRLRKISRLGQDRTKIFPKKIMFIELSEMGSVILSYSAMKKVREMYPEAELYFWIFKDNQESVHILNIMPSIM